MRTEITDRYYRVFTYQQVDRVPDVEFGYWPQTIRRWLREGLPGELATEGGVMFSEKLDAFFGFENEGCPIRPNMDMDPPFEEQVIERKQRSVIMRTADGILAERFGNEVEESSIPRFLDFPVKTPEDWAEMKRRYRLDDPARCVPAEQVAAARAAAGAGRSVVAGCTGFYGQCRHWMGFENLSLAFYDYPDMVLDMIEHWAELAARQLEALPDDVPIDYFAWWEDMASRNGPFVGPEMFRRFCQVGYRRVMSLAKRRGCEIAHVDCDGNPHDIVANWIQEGVNVMFPLEVAAGVDPAAWRRELGMELRLRGGIAKSAVAAGGAALQAELERIRPVFEQGGFIPHLDHLVPPDISYDHYRRYLDRKRKLIGK